jgi:hypothetical protein
VEERGGECWVGLASKEEEEWQGMEKDDGFTCGLRGVFGLRVG